MKYLKEYAQFVESDSLYEPISYDEYIEFVSSKSGWGKPLGFTDQEVNLIKSVLGSEDKFQLLTNGPASKNPDGELISVSGGHYGSWFNKKSSWVVTVTKYRDEWFMGQSEKMLDRKSGRKESKLWKCDTIDGVIQLIKDVSSFVINESVGNSDDYYFEIPKIEMEEIPSKDFMDIDERTLGMIQSNLSDYVKENCPRVSVRLTRDNWIGLDNVGIKISGFDYSNQVGKSHPHSEIKWLRMVKISQLLDEWFLASFSCGDYTIYFKCDQLDGLMRLLEDYYICESKMVKESVEEDKEILSDYFIDFEDGGGKVVVDIRPRKKSSRGSYFDQKVAVYIVTIFTNETRIIKKINWKRLNHDWDILDFDQQNNRSSALPKRSFRIFLAKKGTVTDQFRFPGYPTIGPLLDRTKRQLGLNESNEESLAQKMSVTEWNSFENSHHMIKPDESDYKLYKEFMLDNFTLEEVGNFQNVDYNFGFDWSCEFDELNEEGENYSCGVITIYKFDDEWWVVEHMVKGWHKKYNHWLVDTKEGFKDIKLWD